MEPFEETLRTAAPSATIDPAARGALAELVEARGRDSGRTIRRAGVPVVIGSAALLLGGAGAVAAATGFGPWNLVDDPDYVVARDWYDSTGEYLGTCETRATVEAPSAAVEAAAHEILASLDPARMRPSEEYVAGALFALHREDDYVRLIGAPAPDWSTFSGSWDDLTSEQRAVQSDAHILQIGLIQAIHAEISDRLQAADLDPDFSLTGEGETQCTTDPASRVAQR